MSRNVNLKIIGTFSNTRLIFNEKPFYCFSRKNSRSITNPNKVQLYLNFTKVPGLLYLYTTNNLTRFYKLKKKNNSALFINIGIVSITGGG